jgi:hypothetical protein
MIKPEDVHKGLNTSMLEQEINDEIMRVSEQRTELVIDLLQLPSFYEEGWRELRNRYQQYWITKEKAVSSGGKWVTYLVTFVGR